KRIEVDGPAVIGVELELSEIVWQVARRSVAPVPDYFRPVVAYPSGVKRKKVSLPLHAYAGMRGAPLHKWACIVSGLEQRTGDFFQASRIRCEPASPGDPEAQSVAATGRRGRTQ